MRISAIVCTHNRRGLLLRALQSLANQDLPASDYEVVVVDNASSDGTRVAVEALRGEMPNLVYVYEPALGLSNARNRGLQTAQAEIAAFLDDDAVAGACWLSSLLRAFSNEPVRPLCIGGRVLPAWERVPGSTLPPLARDAVSIVDYGDNARALDFPREWVAGCNMAFERDYLLAAGGFDPRLGRRGKSLTGNEETAVLRRIVGAGGLIKYEPAAAVHHYVPVSRLSTGWLCRRWFAQGVSNVRAGASDLAGPGRKDALLGALSLDRRAGLLQVILICCYALGVLGETLRQTVARRR